MNKLSLVWMQLPEKCKENFDVSSEGPSASVVISQETKSLRSKRRNSPYIFQVLAFLRRKLVHVKYNLVYGEFQKYDENF
jgi:hypothetical protein